MSMFQHALDFVVTFQWFSDVFVFRFCTQFQILHLVLRCSFEASVVILSFELRYKVYVTYFEFWIPRFQFHFKSKS